MKKKLSTMLFSIAMVAALLLTGCSSNSGTSESTTGASTNESTEGSTNESNTSSTGAVKVTDMIGNEINLDAPATKVVVLTASDCEILYALGAGDTVVGRGEYCDYPEEVSSITAVQSGSDTNIEQIIDLKPQVVIMSTMAQTDEQIAALQQAGITTVVSDATTIDEVYTSIELVGAIVGKDAEAKELISNMKTTFDDISSKVNVSGEKKTVYFEVSSLEYGLWAAGSGTFMDEIATMLGLENIFADVDNWGEVSEEQVIERNPDYIVTIAMYYGEGATPVEEITSRTGWQDITAIKEGQVYNADSNEISRPGPRLADAANDLYDFIYGEK